MSSPRFNNAAAAFAIIFVIAAVLSVLSLGATAFWDDESEVGFFGQRFLHDGDFKGWDGRNLFGYRDGTLLRDDLSSINPPLQYVVAAASFRVFGVSAWAGRLPFVLCGWIALAVFYLILAEDYSQSLATRLYSFGIFAFSMTFLLNLRNCRYYALSLLFSLLTYYFYKRALRTKGWLDFLAIAVFATLMFYSSFLLAAAFLLGIAAVHGVFFRTVFDKSGWFRALIAVASFLALTLPYIFIKRIWVRRDIPFDPTPWPLLHLKILVLNIRDLNIAMVFPWVMAIGVAWVLFRRTDPTGAQRQGHEWLCLAFAYIVFLSLLAPQPTSHPLIADIRYFFPCAPFFAGLIGVFLAQIDHRSRPTALGVASVLTCCNLFALTPFGSGLMPYSSTFRLLLPAYLQEVSQPYPTANAAAATFLRQNAQDDDSVLTAPLALEYPLLFHVGDRVRLCCQLDANTPLPLATTSTLTGPVFREDNYPNWIILFGYSEEGIGALRYFSRMHEEHGMAMSYRYVLAKTLNVQCDQGQRPELPWHHFGPVTRFDPNVDAVYIFHRENRNKALAPRR